MIIRTQNDIMREVEIAKRGYQVYEEPGGSLWLIDKTGFAARIRGTDLVAEVVE
jgi:hypothetical protein